MSEASPPVSLAAGITVGLVASFVQSLGLTVQRLSHLANARLPPARRIPDWRRPLWLTGLGVFLLANVAGTLFQLGALPLVVLAPLGAVSLLWNALLARILLGDVFTIQLAVGSALIAIGATLVGSFGVVPEQTHPLPELIALYRRPAFISWVLFLALVLALVLLAAHTAEWSLARTQPAQTGRWSLPVHRPAPALAPRSGSDEPEREPLLLTEDHSTPPPRPRTARGGIGRKRERLQSADAALARAEKTRMWIAAGYGATSGTLSGLCLLITKTGIDLLISTITSRQNQFGHLEAWMILAVLLVCELFQLAYLNRALRLVGPTLVCPLSFCFYNCVSIASGLVFYRQVDVLSPLQVCMLTLGTAVLLGGVWIVSVKPGQGGGSCAASPDLHGRHAHPDAAGGYRENDYEEPEDARTAVHKPLLWTDEPLEMLTEGDSGSSEDEAVVWHPRGFSIGLGAASPGFEIRPRLLNPRVHARTRSADDARTPATAGAARADSDRGGGVVTPHRVGSRRRHGRSESLSGAPYVGGGPPPPPSPSVVVVVGSGGVDGGERVSSPSGGRHLVRRERRASSGLSPTPSVSASPSPSPSPSPSLQADEAAAGSGRGWTNWSAWWGGARPRVRLRQERL